MPRASIKFTPEGKGGQVAAEAHKEIGPSTDGFMLTLTRLNEPQMRQAEVPQILDGPYWDCFINDSFDPATKQGVSVEFSFGAALKPEFKAGLLKLVQWMPPASSERT